MKRGLPWLLGGVALLGLLAVPIWPDDPQTTNRRLEERIDALESRVKRVDERAREAEAKAVSNEAVIEELGRALTALDPKSAAWIDLRDGGGNKWTVSSGAEVTVKFVALNDDDSVSLKVQHKTLDSTFRMRTGESIRAVDDRGTERRVYTTTLHSIERDRTGAPRRARVSVVFTIEGG